MPVDKINGVNLYWQLSGSKGDPLVLVHGSWGDHHNWDNVVNALSNNFRVLTYDRRGHSQSERPNGQGYMEQDIADLIALVEHTGLSPAHLAGNSFGAAIAIKTAAKRQDIFKTLVAHEPPLIGLLKENPSAKPILQTIQARLGAVASLIAKGENENAAIQFVETVALGPGSWQQLPPEVKQTFIYNAPTFLDETGDLQGQEINASKLSYFNKPALLTNGTESPPFFLMILEQLAKYIPAAQRKTIAGAGHVPHMSHPKEYVDIIKEFCLANG